VFERLPSVAEDARPVADVDLDAPDGFVAAPVAVDVSPETGGTVFPGAGAVTLPGVALLLIAPGFPVGEVVAPPVADGFVFAGVQGNQMIGGIFAGLPVDALVRPVIPPSLT
jgi:hypothetical protein